MESRQVQGKCIAGDIMGVTGGFLGGSNQVPTAVIMVLVTAMPTQDGPRSQYLVNSSVESRKLTESFAVGALG